MKTDLTIGACIVKNRRILLLHHAKLGKWLFPGGHIEENETPDQAVLREVKEETGLDFEFLNFSGINKSEDEIEKLAIPFHSNLHSVGDHNHQCLYYLGTVGASEFVMNPESTDIKWFTKEDLLKLRNVPASVRVMALHALEKTG
jgi:8-oxo-dGTP pyrophosphatase MutT (NUDIX family)